MRSHNGMRPQDIVILLKLLTIEKADWQYRDLSSSLFISTSEVSESLKRSQLAGLIDNSRKKVYRQSLMEFIEHGLHYVFPQQPGSMVTGIATAHSHPYYQSLFICDVNYVWEDENGTMRGLAIEPLYKGVVQAVKKDEALYKILASIDIIRVGKTRELKAARQELQNAILHA
jgi:hypothetical protein